ncbi:MAG TPA: type II toxin-antitoxin system HicA family toxin [Bryobacteraceae bacterium]|nr:type II toxin-antitoxin system HicA family toxin [Bryobacteraceae bacterium]
MKALSGKEFVRLLERNGWTVERIQGSHHIFFKAGRTVRISVPVHGNRPLKTGLQAHLMKLAGLPRE